MKKRSLLLIILVLTIILAIPILLTQTQPVYTQYTQPIITPTQTYQFSVNLTTVPSAQINFNVTTNIGVLIAGNVAGFTLSMNATCTDPNILGITINSNSQINSGIMLPISKAFGSDVNMTNPIPFYFTLLPSASETVLLLSSTAGFAGQVSFNLSCTVKTTNATNPTEPVYLDSATAGNPAVSLVLPNPGETPQVITIFNYGLLLLIFLLPITLIVTDRWLKIRRLKKESVEGV